jgi:hypothetical protein
MYVSVLKNRMFENKFLREFGKKYFNESVVPLIEVISLKMGRTTYNIDDLLTLFDSYFDHDFFVDFFTFRESEYKKFDPERVKFSLEIRNESKYKYYDDLLFKVVKTKHGVPVISIKKARSFLNSSAKVIDLIKKLQMHFDKIALRVQCSMFDEYFKVAEKHLREQDYLIYDINEESIESKVFDLMNVQSKSGKYSVIVLHSPRPSHIKNGSYRDGGYTGLIDNSLLNDYVLHGFDGVADYSGLKNVLPTDGGNGQGAALGLFFVRSANKFFSIMNNNTKDGAAGHRYVMKELFNKYIGLIDPTSTCSAVDYINTNVWSKGSSGSWGQWKYITMLRYMDQI